MPPNPVAYKQHVVVTVDGQVDLLALWRADPFTAFRRLRSRLDRVTRLATQRIRLPLFHCNEEIIDSVIQLEQRKIGLRI